MAQLKYPAGGWLAPGTPISWQRDDHGKDFVTPWGHVIQAPGSGWCIGNGSDAPYPNGFGPNFALVHIKDGPFGGNDFYLGHNSSLVSPGQAFAFGHGLALANQGHPSQIGIHPASPPGDGGWTELGQFRNGRCGPSDAWFYAALQRPLVVNVPDKVYRFGDQGPGVLQFTEWLHECGWLTRRWWHFTPQVHGALVAFKCHHNLSIPKPDGGVLDNHTKLVLRRTAHWCRVHQQKEHHR